jgi:hypothetical protein
MCVCVCVCMGIGVGIGIVVMAVISVTIGGRRSGSGSGRGSGSGWRVLGWAGRSLLWSNTNLRGPWPCALLPCWRLAPSLPRCASLLVILRGRRTMLGKRQRPLHTRPNRGAPHSVNVTHAHTRQHAHHHHHHHHHDHHHDHVRHHHHHHCNRLHFPPTWPDLSASCALASPTTLWRLPHNARRQRCDDYLPT